MPPQAGQGVSAAAEDGLTIALMLRHFLAQQLTSTTNDDLDLTDALQRAAKGYQDVQMPRIWSILDRAEYVGHAKRPMNWWEELLRDWIFWIVGQLSRLRFSAHAECLFPLIGKLPESVVNDAILGHHVEAEVERYLQGL